jgi:transcriptional regulator with XRE-family HTH domain
LTYLSNKHRLSNGARQDQTEHPYMPRQRRSSTPPETDEELQLSPRVMAKWRRLAPKGRAFLAQLSGREPLATNLRTARENRALSQDAVAKKVGLSRTLIAQIELANRPVTADELEKFAHLYGTTAVELTGTSVATDDPVTATLLNLAPALLKEFDMQSRIHGVLGELMHVGELERLLDRPAPQGPPTYAVPSPGTLVEALRQGEEIADQERQRLGLGGAPLSDVADLWGAQGVPVFALTLPDALSGLFIAHPSVGVAVVVNATHDAVRQRLAIAHGYAHAVCEPMGTIRVCSQANAKELVERRAEACAAALLLPGSGVAETVHRLGKGQPSRQAYWVLDAAKGQPVRAEARATPWSQTMTVLDGVWIARRFGTTYPVAIARLLGLGLVAESERQRLLRSSTVALAQECLTILGPVAGRVPSSSSSNAVVALSDLSAERFYMAIEAYRRGLVTKADLATEAASLSLQLPGLSDSRLLEIAEAAR